MNDFSRNYSLRQKLDTLARTEILAAEDARAGKAAVT
jgi:hypothetical protein